MSMTGIKKQQNISSGWSAKKLGELAKVYDGTHQTPDYVEDGVPFYSVEHVTSNNFVDTKFISKEVFEKENKRVRLEKGDVLMTRIGDIGTAKYIDWNVSASFYVSLALLKVAKDINARFLSYAISCEEGQRELWSKSIHVAYPKKINLGDISKCELLIPDSEGEQSRIVKILMSWDEAIEKLGQVIELKREIKRGLMQKLLTGELRLPGFSGEWKKYKAGDVFNYLRTYAVSREKLINGKFEDSLIGNIHYGDLHSKYADSIDLTIDEVPQVIDKDFVVKQEDYLCDGDLVMADASEDYEGVGVTVSVHGIGDKKVVGGLHTFVLRDRKGITDEHYRQFIFKTQDIKREFRRIANGVSVYGISKSNIAKLVLSLPSSEEQKEIAGVLQTAEKEITALEKKRGWLQDQKKYLLNNLVTGQIRTPENL